MNLGTMKTALKRVAGLDDSDPLVDWINDAYHELEDAYEWPFLFASVVVSTAANSPLLVGSPADLGKIFNLHVLTAGGASVSGRRGLKYVPPVKFMEDPCFVGTTSTQEPTHYTILNGVVNLWPTPDMVYTLQLRYKKEFPDLVNDVDTPGFPTRMHYTIVRGASVPALQSESEEDRADSAETSFGNAIQRHISRYGGSKQGGSFNTVRDAMGYGNH